MIAEETTEKNAESEGPFNSEELTTLAEIDRRV